MIEAGKRKRVTPPLKFVSKKDLQNMIDQRLFNDIEQQSVHHMGILSVALRLASFVGLYIPYGQTTYLEIVLSQSISDWHAELRSGDIQTAFSAYCISIFKQLPLVLGYTVTAKTVQKPHYSHTWDCTTQTILDWINNSKLDHMTVNVIPHTEPFQVDVRDAAFLLCSKVLTRQELKYIGVVDDIHGLLR
ncbi:hypothetical protein [Rheinheimera sp.]|uniref:hypothetical protein n=1 Tax=Rheinheimera sp. TaxID=1869214 RepID=UPI004047A014